MSCYQFSDHSLCRQQQRGIPPLVVQWLVQYGSVRHDKHGARICYFDLRSRKSLAREVGQNIVDRMGKLLNAYAVLSGDDVVITVGHRTKRIHRS